MYMQVTGKFEEGIKYRCIPEDEFDTLKASHAKFLKWVIDNIEYINKTLCGGKDLLKRAKQALKETKEIT